MTGSDQSKPLPPAAGAGGPRSVDELLPELYEELHALAAHHFRAERRGHTLQTTALLHEAYLRLADQECVGGREHFQALAARTVRRVLCDHARRHGARVGGLRRVPIEELESSALEPDLDF